MEKVIRYIETEVRVVCDGNCHKAWGINNRPKISLSDDEDDVCWLSDDELDIAPEDPGTYEGGYAKPFNSSEFPNKWCVRECERCSRFNLNEPIEIKDWSNRRFNQPFKHKINR